ncbi:MAG: TnpV protein [Clostridia bacterium]|nr:TnpV protein [Clostridia bacterium]
MCSQATSSYLTDINKRAENGFQQLAKELAERENVTEQFKVNAPGVWV